MPVPELVERQQQLGPSRQVETEIDLCSPNQFGTSPPHLGKTLDFVFHHVRIVNLDVPPGEGQHGEMDR